MADNVMWIWDNLTDLGIATDEEIGLAVALCGTSEETLNRILYIRTGYRTIEQMFEDAEEEQRQKNDEDYVCMQKRTYDLQNCFL